MSECKELAGEVIRVSSIFKDGHYGPDIQIEFEDGTRSRPASRTALLSRLPIPEINADRQRFSEITVHLRFPLLSPDE